MSNRGLPLGLASLQRDTAAHQALPPVEKWNPPFCGDMDMRIARDGTWFHEGSPIGRRELARLFSTILRKEGGDYFLVTPVEKVRITVEDVPFIAVLLDAEGAGPSQTLRFTTNMGDEVTANAENPIRVVLNPETAEPSPYIHVRRGLEARISRSVFYQIVDLAMPDPAGQKLGIWSAGQFFILGNPNG